MWWRASPAPPHTTKALAVHHASVVSWLGASTHERTDTRFALTSRSLRCARDSRRLAPPLRRPSLRQSERGRCVRVSPYSANPLFLRRLHPLVLDALVESPIRRRREKDEALSLLRRDVEVQPSESRRAPPIPPRRRSDTPRASRGSARHARRPRRPRLGSRRSAARGAVPVGTGSRWAPQNVGDGWRRSGMSASAALMYARSPADSP